MAKYTITHSCGHTQVHQIYGPDTGPYKAGGLTRREWIAAERAKGPCGACWAADRAEERAGELVVAAGAAAAAGLPVLTGTERQTAAAERLRAELMGVLSEHLRRGGLPADITEAILQIWTRVVGRLPAEASWWIDHPGPAGRSAAQAALTETDKNAIQAYADLAKTRMTATDGSST